MIGMARAGGFEEGDEGEETGESADDYVDDDDDDDEVEEALEGRWRVHDDDGGKDGADEEGE
jgi:hypothetical protein